MDSVENLVAKVTKLAYKYEAEMGSCPQCVLSALMETLDVGDKLTIKAADSLAGGTALSSKGTCGALIGGMLAIGALEGRDYEDFKDGKTARRVFKYAKKLFDKFIQEYGSSNCEGVQKRIFGRSYSLLDPKEYKEFEKAGAHIDKCPSVAGNVAKWTAEIILKDIRK